MEDLIILVVLLAVGYGVGSWNERRHYKSIERREKGLLSKAFVTFDKAYSRGEIETASLVTGNAVISVDYFKRIVAGLRNFFGGRVSTYETLLDRARREALLRMRESMPDADMIVNVRLETSSIGKSADQRQALGSIEAMAYGTALKFKPSES